ncbi:BsuBI/PstI family type II restriction endonuclease [Candidatus Poriferisodalis sp.]|uniref:BsuBI/PstI family type II restriction endonuclease n=1 Tax=Candidatus Poriferisodalis sp. TaxID=3101277 RepID=UPI003B5C5B66
MTELGFPSAQSNDRSALVLLALLDLGPDSAWSDAGAPLRGITEMMDFMRTRYGKNYAPNSRESVRRKTVHQFCAAGLAVINPNEPDRPTNSGLTVYQISSLARGLMRAHGTGAWPQLRDDYLARVGTMASRLERRRQMRRIPVRLPDGSDIDLSPGGQNPLIAEVIEEFCSRFTPGGQVWYVGDADSKFAVFEEDSFVEAGIHTGRHGKMPDLIVHDARRDWLVVVEAVTSHGPIDPKRRNELDELLGSTSLDLVYITAFADRPTFRQFASDIAWETDVWIAESPDHLIHYDGDRFLGPYE